MTDNTMDRNSAARLYQVSYMIWTAPIFVIAPSFRAAAIIAKCASNLPESAGRMTVLDVTEQFLGLSRRARNHTQRLISAAHLGVVDYDDVLGWISIENG